MKPETLECLKETVGNKWEIKKVQDYIDDYVNQFSHDTEKWLAEDGFIKGFEYRQKEVEELVEKWFKWDVKCCDLKIELEDTKKNLGNVIEQQSQSLDEQEHVIKEQEFQIHELVQTLNDLITNHCVTPCSNKNNAVEVLKKYIPKIIMNDE